MTDVRKTLAEIQAKTEAATPGPWIAKDLSDVEYSPDDNTGWWWVWQESKLPYYGGILESHDGDGEGAIGPATIDDNRTGVQEHADAEFIAMARTAMPALLSAVKKVLALKPAHFGCDPEGQALAEGHDLALRNVRKAIQEALGGVNHD